MEFYVVVFVVAATFFIYERLAPAVNFPEVPNWFIRAAAINLLQVSIIFLAGATWNTWFKEQSLFQLGDVIHPATGGALAFLIATFFFYWWHRARHEVPALWRLFHQMHHSPQRIEVLTSNYLHPFDTISTSLIGSGILYGLLGLGAAGAGWYFVFLSAIGFFNHSNTNAPHWLGYVIQTPNMHRVHHEYGVHASNYADLVWWDMLFGTWVNPRENIQRCGFDPEREAQWPAMLAFQDVYRD